MADLTIPSLVIYPIGVVQSIDHRGLGDIVVDLITMRESLGKATWVVNSVGLSNTPEIRSSEKLRLHLMGDFPKLVLDEDIENLSSPLTSVSSGASSGNTNTGVDFDTYNLFKNK
jgi:hypothetical protein